jgi:hypothetical protein
MVRNTGKQNADGKGNERETKGKLDDELDALFRLPVAEFTAARNALAAQLKKSGRRDDSERVKALGKPSVTAWAVNQLYWTHREAFDRLIATGEHFRKLQKSGGGAKLADMREALEARRAELSHLSDLATALLREAGHNPTPDTIHRITTTLEGVSAYESFPDDARPGHLTRDVDPPGFDSFASLIPGNGMKKMKPEPVQVTSQKSDRAASKPQKTDSTSKTSNLEQKRQAEIAAAKVSLQEAKTLLSEARASVQSLEATQKKANADAKEAEKELREAEERFEKARAASEEAVRHAQDITAETQQAVRAVRDSEGGVEKASKDLEKLFRESRVK